MSGYSRMIVKNGEKKTLIKSHRIPKEAGRKPLQGQEVIERSFRKIQNLLFLLGQHYYENVKALRQLSLHETSRSDGFSPPFATTNVVMILEAHFLTDLKKVL